MAADSDSVVNEKQTRLNKANLSYIEEFRSSEFTLTKLKRFRINRLSLCSPFKWIITRRHGSSEHRNSIETVLTLSSALNRFTTR